MAHAHELGNEVPTSPVIFMKPATSVLAANKNFTIPSFTNDLHYEGELVLRVSQEVKNLKNTKIWCFGHNHKPLDKMLGNTRLICNPQGYPKENPYFEIKTIEV